MPKAINVIPTRQKADLLFSTDTPLGAGATFVSPIREVDGYNAVTFLAIASTAFTIVVNEACEAGGPFVETATLTSSVVAGQNVVCARVFPCGSFMRTSLGNLGGAQTALSYCAHGVPEP